MTVANTGKWPTKRLSQLAEFRNGVNYNKSSFGRGIKVVGVSDFQNHFKPRYGELEEINPEGIVTDQNILRDGDIVFVRSNGNRELIGRSLYIERPPEPVTHSAFTIRLRFVSSDVYPLFYAYWFRTPLIRKGLTAYGGGTNISNLNQDILNALEVPVPSVQVQRQIAGVLAAYDELIENSQRRIRILETIARSLYREWFVNFRFPGHENVRRVPSALGEIPEGWEVKPFSVIANFVNGYAFKPSDLGSEGSPIIKIKELKAGIKHDTPRNPGTGLPSKFIVRDGHILFSWSADLDTYMWAGGNGLLNQHLFNVHPSDGLSRVFCFYALKEAMPRFRALSLGATMQHIKRSALDQVFTLVPPTELRKRLDEMIDPMHQMLIFLSRQADNLQKTRDVLLPRLLSGGAWVNAEQSMHTATEANHTLQKQNGTSVVIDRAPPARDSNPISNVKPTSTPLERTTAIDETDRTDVLCAIRNLFNDDQERERDTAIRELAHVLGYQRTGSRVYEVLSTDLQTAVRRGIVVNVGGVYRRGFRTLADCTRDSLKKDFESAIGRGWTTREDAIRALARWLGFARVGAIIDETGRSLINGLIREGRLETDGPDRIRRL